MEFTNLITAFYPGLYTPFQPPIQSSLSAGLQEMPHFRFSIQNIIDGKSKREEDIIFHVEMTEGNQTILIEAERKKIKTSCYCHIYYVLGEAIWDKINWLVSVANCIIILLSIVH